MDILLIAICGLVVIVAALVYVYFFQGKGIGKQVRILLFEQIGNDKVYKGEMVGLEKDDEKLGIYFYIKKVKHAISDVRNDDLFYDKKYGKALLVCKYAADDYKVMGRLGAGDWARAVPILNKAGEVEKYEYEPYEEPLGVTQEDREVARFNSDYRARMAEFRQEKKGFWEKFAPFITVGFLGLILLMAFAFMSNKTAETQQHIADTFVVGAGGYQEAMTSPSFAEGLLKKWEEKQREAEAPVR